MVDNDIELNSFVLVDDYNHLPKHVMIVFDKEIIMLMVDDVLLLMLEQLLVEVLMDLLDDDFLLSKNDFNIEQKKE